MVKKWFSKGTDQNENKCENVVLQLIIYTYTHKHTGAATSIDIYARMYTYGYPLA